MRSHTRARPYVLAAALGVVALASSPVVAAATTTDLPVRALAARPEYSGDGPALLGDRVYYARPSARGRVRVFGEPLVGGPAAELARIKPPGLAPGYAPSWMLAAGEGGLALRVFGSKSGSLWAGPATGPLTVVKRRARAGAPNADERDLFVVPGGPLVLERVDRAGRRLRAVLRPPGGLARSVAFPAGADLHHLAVTGSMAAVGVPRSDEIVIVALPSGAVRARLKLGDVAGTEVQGLALSQAGDVALTVEDGAGVDGLAWAPAGAAAARVVLTGDDFGFVATAGGRIAMQQAGPGGDGARAIVLDPAPGVPVVLYRGPAAAAMRSLANDGTHVAWSTDGCQLLAPAQARASSNLIPAGRCVRTEASFTSYAGLTHRRGRVTKRMRVHCLTGPGGRCRIDARFYAGKTVSRKSATIPVGRTRSVYFALSRRALAYLRRDSFAGITEARVRDPDGRSRLAFFG